MHINKYPMESLPGYYDTQEQSQLSVSFVIQFVKYFIFVLFVNSKQNTLRKRCISEKFKIKKNIFTKTFHS